MKRILITLCVLAMNSWLLYARPCLSPNPFPQGEEEVPAPCGEGGGRGGSPVGGWEAVLSQVAENNKTLQANSRRAEAQKLESLAANNLPDPTVSYTRQYGNKAGLGINGELIASQSFDFPTLYAERSRLAKQIAGNLDLQQAELRRQILLEAKEICFDIILLRRQKQILDDRLANTEELEKLYAKRLESGDANLLETNKISLERLNVLTESRRNAATLLEKQKALEALNGGIPIDFDADGYGQGEAELPSFETLYGEALALDPALLALLGEQRVARQTLRVSKSQGLPGLEIGYQLNTAAHGERFNGFLVGLSIPLFSNRHKVRQARADVLYSELKYDDIAAQMKSDLFQRYHQALSLKESMTEYERLLKAQNSLTLLNKALEAGRISMIEYFVEVASCYDSLNNYAELENAYHKAVARLLKHKL
ncbi:MAG: TolC family protein [Bacteroidales bacterium]